MAAENALRSDEVWPEESDRLYLRQGGPSSNNGHGAGSSDSGESSSSGSSNNNNNNSNSNNNGTSTSSRIPTRDGNTTEPLDSRSGLVNTGLAHMHVFDRSSYSTPHTVSSKRISLRSNRSLDRPISFQSSWGSTRGSFNRELDGRDIQNTSNSINREDAQIRHGHEFDEQGTNYPTRFSDYVADARIIPRDNTNIPEPWQLHRLSFDNPRQEPNTSALPHTGLFERFIERYTHSYTNNSDNTHVEQPRDMAPDLPDTALNDMYAATNTQTYSLDSSPQLGSVAYHSAGSEIDDDSDILRIPDANIWIPSLDLSIGSLDIQDLDQAVASRRNSVSHNGTRSEPPSSFEIPHTYGGNSPAASTLSIDDHIPPCYGSIPHTQHMLQETTQHGEMSDQQILIEEPIMSMTSPPLSCEPSSAFPVGTSQIPATQLQDSGSSSESFSTTNALCASEKNELETLRERFAALSAEMVVHKREMELADTRISRIRAALQCSICIEILRKPYSLRCGHTFCQDCLVQWLKRNKICPTCREPVITRPAIAYAIQDIIDEVPNDSESELSDSESLACCPHPCICGPDQQSVHQTTPDRPVDDPWEEIFPQRDFLGMGGIAGTHNIIQCENCAHWGPAGHRCVFCYLTDRQPRTASSNNDNLFSSRISSETRRILDSSNNTSDVLIQLRNLMTATRSSINNNMTRLPSTQNDESATQVHADSIGDSSTRALGSLSRRGLSQSPPDSLFDFDGDQHNDEQDIHADGDGRAEPRETGSSGSFGGVRRSPIRWIQQETTSSPRPLASRNANSISEYQQQHRREGNDLWRDNRYHANQQHFHTDGVGGSPTSFSSSAARGIDDGGSTRRLIRLRNARTNQSTQNGTDTTNRNPIRISHIIGQGRDGSPRITRAQSPQASQNTLQPTGVANSSNGRGHTLRPEISHRTPVAATVSRIHTLSTANVMQHYSQNRQRMTGRIPLTASVSTAHLGSNTRRGHVNRSRNESASRYLHEPWAHILGDDDEDDDDSMDGSIEDGNSIDEDEEDPGAAESEYGDEILPARGISRAYSQYTPSLQLDRNMTPTQQFLYRRRQQRQMERERDNSAGFFATTAASTTLSSQPVTNSSNTDEHTNISSSMARVSAYQRVLARLRSPRNYQEHNQYHNEQAYEDHY